jgi:peptide/nickel transport system substrate-binding protein
VPALAEQLPEISDDALSYLFHLRPGLRYSDGGEVRASDFERAVERLREMGSPGVPLFAGLSEIEADDDARTVEFRLAAPQADFLDVLATPFAAPVPKGTKPVEQVVPSTGPYRIDAHVAGRRVVLVRNERFRPTGVLRPGNPDRIVVEVGRRGGADYSFAGARGAQVRLSAASSTSYFFLNTQVPPFDRTQARRAVAFAIDRGRLAELASGPAEPAQGLLPPGVPGHRPLELYERNLEQARALVAEEGAEGARVAVWGSTLPGTRRAARYLVGVLREIGLRARYLELPADDYLLRAGSARRMQAGVASWSGTTAHPLGWFRALLHGDRTEERVNTNLARADVPELNDLIDELARQPLLTDDVEARWAELERWAAEQALVVPFSHGRRVESFGERIDVESCWLSHVVFRIDLGRLCVAAEGRS